MHQEQMRTNGARHPAGGKTAVLLKTETGSGAALETQPALSSAFTATPPIQKEHVSARSLTPNRVFYPAGVAPRW